MGTHAKYTEARLAELAILHLPHNADALTKKLEEIRGKLQRGEKLTPEDGVHISNISECLVQNIKDLAPTEDAFQVQDRAAAQKAVDQLVRELKQDEETTLGQLEFLNEAPAKHTVIFREHNTVVQHQKADVLLPQVLIDNPDFSELFMIAMESVRDELVQKFEVTDSDTDLTEICWDED